MLDTYSAHCNSSFLTGPTRSFGSTHEIKPPKFPKPLPKRPIKAAKTSRKFRNFSPLPALQSPRARSIDRFITNLKLISKSFPRVESAKSRNLLLPTQPIFYISLSDGSPLLSQLRWSPKRRASLAYVSSSICSASGSVCLHSDPDCASARAGDAEQACGAEGRGCAAARDTAAAAGLRHGWVHGERRLHWTRCHGRSGYGSRLLWWRRRRTSTRGCARRCRCQI